MKNKQKGFTLIELLVVISIIALLSSIVLASLQDARNKAKKSAFVQDLHQVQLALELYKNTNGYYPYENYSDSPGLHIDKGTNYPKDDQTTTKMSADPLDTGQESFIPKYISRFPEPLTIGTSGSEYNSIEYINPFEIIDYNDKYSNGNDWAFCGTKPIKGYLIIFVSAESIQLPQVFNTSGNLVNSYYYCATGN